MPRGRGVGDVDDHADGVVGLPRGAVAMSDGVTAMVHEFVGHLVVIVNHTETGVAVGYLHRVGANVRRGVDDGIDTELLGAGRRCAGRRNGIERMAVVRRRIADQLQHVAVAQVAADTDGHSFGSRGVRRQDAQVVAVGIYDDFEQRIATRHLPEVGGMSATGTAAGSQPADRCLRTIRAGASLLRGAGTELGLHDLIVRRGGGRRFGKRRWRHAKHNKHWYCQQSEVA